MPVKPTGVISLTLRHNQPYMIGQSVRPSIKPRSSTRSANRNGHRPAAIVTNASSSAASVQPTGSENCRPSASRKNTRSCDHVCRTARNTNSRPNHGGTGVSPEQFADQKRDQAQLTTRDNALAETINGLYKTELIKPRKPWRTIEEVELATAEWVHRFNHRRLYQYSGDIPPVEMEVAYYARNQRPAAG
jgi:hypothetical protein